MKKVVLFCCLLSFTLPSLAQKVESNKQTKNEPEKNEKKKLSFWDPMDGYFDLSQFVLQMHGFVPVPIIITEPAVGGFGLGIVPVFIQRNEPEIREGKPYPVSPDITMAGVAYTLNNSWLLAGGRFGHISKYGLNYKMAVAYADANLDFYQYLPKQNIEEKFGFNMEAVPVYLFVSKELWDPRFTIGLDYVYTNIKMKPDFGLNVPESWIKTFESNISTVGILAEFDNRDNTFTPNKGIKASLKAKFSSELIGSDYNIQQTEEAFYWYTQLTDKWVNGLRIDLQQIYGDAPFYMKPYVDMRGVPALKYQGDNTALMELEERYDIGETNRWSVVAFGGLGKGFDKTSEFEEMPLAWSYGVGGRYLISRLLNLRMGIDVTYGPDGPSWYIVFGTSWIRQ